jgi:hypothetical protein
MKQTHPVERHVNTAEKALAAYQKSVADALRATAETLKVLRVPNYQVAKTLEMDDTYFSDILAGKYPFPATKIVRLFNTVLIEVQKRNPADKASDRQAACLLNMIKRWAAVGHAWKQFAGPVSSALTLWNAELNKQEPTAEDAVKWQAEARQVKTIAKTMESHGKMMEGFIRFQTDLHRSFKDVENGAPFVRIELPSA